MSAHSKRLMGVATVVLLLGVVWFYTTRVQPVPNTTVAQAEHPGDNTPFQQTGPTQVMSPPIKGTQLDASPPPLGSIPVSIGRGSYETDKDVPAFLVLKKIIEDYLAQPDREEYDLFDITIFVHQTAHRYLAVGKLFNNDERGILPEIRRQLASWTKARYTGDFAPYRLYELD